MLNVCPRGPNWCKHIEQLQPRHGTEEDKDPGDIYSDTPQNEPEALTDETTDTSQEPPTSTMEYGPENPRRSQRKHKKKVPYVS